MSSIKLDVKYISSLQRNGRQNRRSLRCACFNFRSHWRRSEDEDRGKHHQYNNRDTERQELTGQALEIARSRTFVVLHCHGCLSYTVVRTSGFERGGASSRGAAFSFDGGLGLAGSSRASQDGTRHSLARQRLKIIRLDV